MSKKDETLFCLKKEKGNWISGELLSNKLGITRSAVWKHIRSLKEDGYLIKSLPKRGYLLCRAHDLILKSEVREGLDTRIFGNKDVVCLKEADSTNSIARNMAERSAPEGTAIISEMQTMGRGRRKNSWFSPPGKGVYISLIARPSMSPVEASRVSLMTSVAAAEALHEVTNLDIKIKWPNDIMINKKKLGGILTEVNMEMDEIEYIVVGLGLNVNISDKDFPDDIKGKAASILTETGKKYPRIDLIKNYLEKFEKYYETLQSGDFRIVMERWKKFENVTGRKVAVDMVNKRYTGKALYVDENGTLIIKDDKGKTHGIFSGSLSFLD